jgi:anti-anti-sigma factor
MTHLEVHASQERGCWIVRLQDDVDHATVPYWKGVLDLLPRSARVAVDLEAVRYVDSAGIALLLWLRRRVADASGAMALARAPHFLERIFRVAGIPTLIPCYADLPAAVAALGPGEEPGLGRGPRGDEAAPAAAAP